MAAWTLTMHRHTNIVSFWQVQTTTVVQNVCLSKNQALASSTMLGLDALHMANVFVNHPALKSVGPWFSLLTVICGLECS